MPSLEAPHLETHFGYTVVVVGWRCCLCATVEEARLVRVGREVRRAHGGVASGWRAWCSGDLGDGWAEVLLSLQF